MNRMKCVKFMLEFFVSASCQMYDEEEKFPCAIFGDYESHGLSVSLLRFYRVVFRAVCYCIIEADIGLFLFYKYNFYRTKTSQKDVAVLCVFLSVSPLLKSQNDKYDHPSTAYTIQP